MSSEGNPMDCKVLCQVDGAIATVSLANPGKRNAVNADMWRQLTDAMRALSADESLRCVVLRGAGDEAFAAGGDIDELETIRATPEQAESFHGQLVASTMQAIVDCMHPTVALIHGACIGGGLEIAGQCDLRICGESSRFGIPINKLGFTMYHGELRSLLALVGPAVALELLLEGRILDAEAAYAKGLVTRVVADAEVEQETYATARRIAAGAPLVARSHKRLVRRLIPWAEPLTAAEAAENLAYLDSEDYRIGMAAFASKQSPRFRGR